jgi:hypothetical protein
MGGTADDAGHPARVAVSPAAALNTARLAIPFFLLRAMPRTSLKDAARTLQGSRKARAFIEFR